MIPPLIADAAMACPAAIFEALGAISAAAGGGLLGGAAAGLTAGAIGGGLAAVAKQIQAAIDGHMPWDNIIGTLKDSSIAIGTGAVSGGITGGVGGALGIGLGSTAAAAGGASGVGPVAGQSLAQVAQQGLTNAAGSGALGAARAAIMGEDPGRAAMFGAATGGAGGLASGAARAGIGAFGPDAPNMSTEPPMMSTPPPSPTGYDVAQSFGPKFAGQTAGSMVGSALSPGPPMPGLPQDRFGRPVILYR